MTDLKTRMLKKRLKRRRQMDVEKNVKKKRADDMKKKERKRECKKQE